MISSTLFTLGHSRHSADRFADLLRAHAIDQLVDVRSQPISKWSPHFAKTSLAALLGAHNVSYVFMGGVLDGRPMGRAFYRQDGSVDYARRAAASDFRDGIEQLVECARVRRTVILCAEEDPTHCHRRLLVAPAIAQYGVRVVHVRGNGLLEPEVQDPVRTQQLDLF